MTAPAFSTKKSGGDVSPSERINKLRKYKIIQSVIYFSLSLIWIGTFYRSLNEPPTWLSPWIVLAAHPITQVIICIVLVKAVLAVIAAVLLHTGNKKDNPKDLQDALAFCYLSYTPFDTCLGGIAAVRQRVVEIEMSSMYVVCKK